MTMAYSSTTLSLLISAPSDIPSEDLDLIRRVVNQWNASYGRAFSLTVLPVSWTENAVSQFGDRAQVSINQQLVDTSDFAIAVFNRRLGTATGEAKSGTAEEIWRMAAAGKPVSILRTMTPQPPLTGTRNIEEQLRLENFLQDEVFGRALVLSYRTSDELSQHVNNMLSTHTEKFRFHALSMAPEANSADASVRGVWPRIEVIDAVVTSNRGQLRTKRTRELVLENTTGKPVNNVSYQFESEHTFNLDTTPVTPIKIMAPSATVRYPLLLLNQPFARAECHVTWNDEVGTHVTSASVHT